MIVRVYAGGLSAVVFLLGYFLVVWFVGSLCRIVSGPLTLMLASVPWTCCGWVCHSPVAAWAYVIMGMGVGSPPEGLVCLLL